MNRRQFLGYLGALAAGTILPSCTSTQSQKQAQKQPDVRLQSPAPQKSLENIIITPANQKLRSFPTFLPWIGKTEKHEVPGAKYCFIHIKQMHRVHGDTAKQIYEEIDDERARRSLIANTKYKWQKIDYIQKDIYFILNNLATDHNLKDVRAESFTKQFSKPELEKLYGQESYNILLECYPTLEEVMYNQKEFLYAPGAALLLGILGKINLLPGEDKKLNEIAAKNAEKDENHPSIYDPRENFTLKTIAQYDIPAVIGIYGAKHDFKNNIENWNQENPDKKFSWIVVTPKSLME